MILPPSLKSGDLVGLVAPAKKVSAHTLEFAQQVIESWGLQVRQGKHVLSGSHSYFSGTDEERKTDLQRMLDDPEVKAIICARGAYGATRIVDELDLSGVHAHAKWVVGFSDITAIHLRLYADGIASLHGTMPINFEDPGFDTSTLSLRVALFGMPPPVSFVGQLNRSGLSQGPVIGGNLSILLEAMGTASEPDTAGCLLVIEETDEFMHKVDRMMNQLKRAGKLDRLAGLIIGHMTRIQNNDPPFNESVQQLILQHVAHTSYPVAFGFPAGHEPPNLTWRHGGMARLNVQSNTATLTFLA